MSSAFDKAWLFLKQDEGLGRREIDWGGQRQYLKPCPQCGKPTAPGELNHYIMDDSGPSGHGVCYDCAPHKIPVSHEVDGEEYQ